jgi:hypothetical protein
MIQANYSPDRISQTTPVIDNGLRFSIENYTGNLLEDRPTGEYLQGASSITALPGPKLPLSNSTQELVKVCYINPYNTTPNPPTSSEESYF